MNKVIDFSDFENIADVKLISDMGGTFLDIKFTNGTTLRVAPENDVVVYAEPGFEPGDGPKHFFFCDMGSGHHTPGEKPSLLQD